MDVIQILRTIQNDPIHLLDAEIPHATYVPLDLSVDNNELKTVDITDVSECQRYIDQVLDANHARVAYGGYLEKRALYSKSENFAGPTARNIHLGMDFWCVAGTKVLAPLEGTVHSFGNNTTPGDYGPTIILRHTLGDFEFYSLYGHLSEASLGGLKKSKIIHQGDQIGTLGGAKVNGGYAPHLHFQLIVNIQEYDGDYPGVCHETDLNFYAKNCPNPNLLCKL